MSAQKNNNLKLWCMENGCRVTKPLSSLCVCALWSEACLTSSSVVHDDANYCSCETCHGQFLQRSLKQTEVFLSTATRRWKTASHPRWHQGSFFAAAVNMYHKCKNLLMVWESYNRNGPAERPPVGDRRSAPTGVPPWDKFYPKFKVQFHILESHSYTKGRISWFILLPREMNLFALSEGCVFLLRCRKISIETFPP